MNNVVRPVRLPRIPDYPQQFCPATQRRVTVALEAADEAELAGDWALADWLVSVARREVASVLERMGWAA